MRIFVDEEETSTPTDVFEEQLPECQAELEIGGNR